MYRPSTFLWLCLPFVLAGPGSARGSVPSPATSFVDPCLIVCPHGDIAFHVVVRDVAGNPVPNSTVMIDFCGCPEVRLCPPRPNDPYVTSGCMIFAATNALGQVAFPIRAGGTCSGLHATITADGVMLASREVASPDQDGNLAVDGTDMTILSGKIGAGPYDGTADLDCSGTLDAADLLVGNDHFGHTCDNVVPVRPRSWGRVKTIYR